MAWAVVSRARALRALRRPGNTHAQVQETEAFLWFRAVSSCGLQALLYWPYDPGPVPSPLWAQVAAALPSSCRRGIRAPVDRVYTRGSSWDPWSPMGGLHAVGEPRGGPLLHTSDAPLSTRWEHYVLTGLGCVPLGSLPWNEQKCSTYELWVPPRGVSHAGGLRAVGGPFTFEGCFECIPGCQGAMKPSLRSGPAGAEPTRMSSPGCLCY